jgi:hypothetical protein
MAVAVRDAKLHRPVARDVAVARRLVADSIVYLCALIADQPRAIDRYIDYFGEGRIRRAARRPGL